MTATSSDVRNYRGLDEGEFAEWLTVTRTVADTLASTALARDRANADPHEEISLLRESGLLGFAIPREFGGAGADLEQALKVSRVISAADGSIGQLIAYHYSNGVWTYILGTSRQWEATARGVGEQGWFQGGVSNPRDPKVDLRHLSDGTYRINGKRTFATGASIAGILTVTVWDGERLVNLQIPPTRAGITFGEDWDNLGQRLTASGSVTFDDVEASPADLLTGLDTFEGNIARRNGLRTLFSQLIFAHLYLGIAQGALTAAATHVRAHSRPWPESGVSEAVDDPYSLQLFGKHSARIAAGTALADNASRQYQQILEAGADVTAQQWGELAVLIDQTKSVATSVSLAATADIFQATGARSTSNEYGLDIYWRNVRTHTTHDPVPYREREIGRHILAETLPTPHEFAPPAEDTNR